MHEKQQMLPKFFAPGGTYELMLKKNIKFEKQLMHEKQQMLPKFFPRSHICAHAGNNTKFEKQFMHERQQILPKFFASGGTYELMLKKAQSLKSNSCMNSSKCCPNFSPQEAHMCSCCKKHKNWEAIHA